MTFTWVIGYLGQKTLAPFQFVFEALFLAYASVRAFFVNEVRGVRPLLQVISQQVYFTGFQALPLITVLSLATGSLVIFQASSQISMLGGHAMMGQLLVAIVLRELAPLMTALVVVARSGTAIASEIGNMKVNREIEALEVMGIHPFSYVVFPRLVGGTLSMMCLGIYFALIAFIGGFFVAQLFQPMSFQVFSDAVSRAILPRDILFFALKIFLAGLFVFSISCYYGLSVKKGSHEVPQVTTKAVVNSLLVVTAFQISVSLIFYIVLLMELGFI